MGIKKKHKAVWDTLICLQKEGKLKPSLYYGNRSVVRGTDSIIAKDSAKNIFVNRTDGPDPSESEVVNIVDMVINSAIRAIKSFREDRTSVMCEIHDESGKTITVYFSSYESERIISTEIWTSAVAVTIPS